MVLLALVPLLAVAVGTAVANKAPEGPQFYAPGAEPGSDKEKLIQQEQSDYEDAVKVPMAPIQGPPKEDWVPEVHEGLIESPSSPYEGMRPFIAESAWESSTSARGTVTTIYAGHEGDHGLLIILELDLFKTGLEVRHLEVGVAGLHPRILSVAAGAASLTDESGQHFLVSLTDGSLATP